MAATQQEGVIMKSAAETLVEEGMMSVGEAMEFLSISRSHLYELMNKREIPWAKIGRSRRIPRSFLVSFVAASLRGLDDMRTLKEG
jgi:excisionase family DNA binding protein